MQRVAGGFTRPNGIALAPDGKTLSVADLGANVTFAFPVEGLGRLGQRRRFADIGSDGFAMDKRGNLDMTPTSPGIRVVAPLGETGCGGLIARFANNRLFRGIRVMAPALLAGLDDKAYRWDGSLGSRTTDPIPGVSYGKPLMTMPSTAAITGILTPHMVPLDARGEINEDELARYVEWLIQHGVHGLYPNGSTGEFLRFTAEERRRIVQVVCAAAKGRVPVVAGAAEANVRETIRACEHCLDAGARAVAVVSPFYYKLSPESVYAYFREIGRHSPIDVTLYNIPMLASPIDVPTVQRLAAEFPRIIGIKDSSGDISHMSRLIAAVRPIRPDFSFLTGWEAALVPMLLAGCDGGTHATSGIVPELTRSIYDAVRAGRIDEAFALQRTLLEIFDPLIQCADFPEGFRVAAEVCGFAMGASRQPATESQLADRGKLAGRIREQLAAHGMSRG